MKEKLKFILLIDDDEATNFIHRIVINKAGVAEEVRAMQSAEEALKFLSTLNNGEYPKPDIIFLDLNMPRMNGWEFLEEYKKLEKAQKAHRVLIMLTTSLNPDDKDNANKIEDISGFMNKPLTTENLIALIQEHFGE